MHGLIRWNLNYIMVTIDDQTKSNLNLKHIVVLTDFFVVFINIIVEHDGTIYTLFVWQISGRPTIVLFTTREGNTSSPKNTVRVALFPTPKTTLNPHHI